MSPGRRTQAGSRDGPLEFDADHSLNWDADSKKLAFGLGNQVSTLYHLTAIKSSTDASI